VSSGISYCDEVWSPVTGCTPVSEGCEHCWAREMTRRFPAITGGDFAPRFHPERLDQPLHWRKPRVIFVAAMGDLFHQDVPDTTILHIFTQIRRADRHTYLLLTKRSQAMLTIATYLSWYSSDIPGCWQAYMGRPGATPLQNVWLGITAENQQRLDERVPDLLSTPAAHRWLSLEPVLGRMNLTGYLRGLGAVIFGAESGPYRRPCPHDWARQVRNQCAEAGVPFYLKQLAENEDGTGKVVHLPYLDGRQHLDLPWRAIRPDD
jgi:protein gp37